MAQFADHAWRALTQPGERGQTRRSICSAMPSTGPMMVPAAVERIVAELGLRYRPTSTADLRAHAGRLALLARDLADAPSLMLEQAATDWAKVSRFMPTAAELIETMQRCLDADRTARMGKNAGRLAEHYNNRMTMEGARQDVRWIGAGDSLRLAPATG